MTQNHKAILSCNPKMTNSKDFKKQDSNLIKWPDGIPEGVMETATE